MIPGTRLCLIKTAGDLASQESREGVDMMEGQLSDGAHLSHSTAGKQHRQSGDVEFRGK